MSEPEAMTPTEAALYDEARAAGSIIAAERVEQYVEHRVKLTREEFRKVATGQYPKGEAPTFGPPTVALVDKRGRNNPTAARRAQEAAQRRADAEAKRQAQADWARLSAGTMWWAAQTAGQHGQNHLAERILGKRAELVDGAIEQGILTP